MKYTTKILTIIAITISTFSSCFAQVLFTEKVGSDKGESFLLPSTRYDILSNQRIKRIAIQHTNRRVEQIILMYSTSESEIKVDSIGNDRGEWSYIDLEDGEYVVNVTGRAGTLIDQISFHTTLRRTFGPYGGTGGQDFDLSIPSNAVVIGFFGKSGPSINKIGLIYRVMNESETKPKSAKREIRDHRKKKKNYFRKLKVSPSKAKAPNIKTTEDNKVQIEQNRFVYKRSYSFFE